MRYVRRHEGAVFFMSPRVDDDLRIRAALGGVMLAGSDDDRAIIERSLRPLRALAAMMAGVPVDFAALDTEGIVPIAALWRESADAARKEGEG